MIEILDRCGWCGIPITAPEYVLEVPDTMRIAYDRSECLALAAIINVRHDGLTDGPTSENTNARTYADEFAASVPEPAVASVLAEIQGGA